MASAGVGGQGAPAGGHHDGVLIGGGGGAQHVGGPDHTLHAKSEGGALHHGDYKSVILFLAGQAFIGADDRVGHGQVCVAAGPDGGADDTGGVDHRIVNGHIGLTVGHEARAPAAEVVAAVALQAHLQPVDGVLGAADVDSVEEVALGGDRHVLGRGVVISTGDGVGHRGVLVDAAGGDQQSLPEIKFRRGGARLPGGRAGTAVAHGGIREGIGLHAGEGRPGGNIPLDAVDHQGQHLIRRGGDGLFLAVFRVGDGGDMGGRAGRSRFVCGHIGDDQRGVRGESAHTAQRQHHGRRQEYGQCPPPRSFHVHSSLFSRSFPRSGRRARSCRPGSSSRL